MQWLMLQQEQPEDFVIATGRQESVRRFVELTLKNSVRRTGMAKAPLKWAAAGIPVNGGAIDRVTERLGWNVAW